VSLLSAWRNHGQTKCALVTVKYYRDMEVVASVDLDPGGDGSTRNWAPVTSTVSRLAVQSHSVAGIIK
jgi:hypothetical protein